MTEKECLNRKVSHNLLLYLRWMKYVMDKSRFEIEKKKSMAFKIHFKSISFQGIQKQFSKVRRPDNGDQEELVPLTLSADDSHDVTLDGTMKEKDVFETPPSSPEIADEFTNGDLYKEKIRDDDVETRCGYWQCRPDALQKCNNPKALLMFLCCFSMAQGKALM